jgi:uncharacterized membrane protein
MILMDQTTEQASSVRSRGDERQGRQQRQDQQATQGEQAQQSSANVGASERAVSVAAGAIVGLLGLRRGSLPGLLCAGVGGMMVYRGVTGHCAVYESLGLNTAEDQEEGQAFLENLDNGIHVEQAFLINRSQADLYNYWRNFENLPRIMSHLESVRVIDKRRSHWVANAPRIVGGKVEWDAEITRDDPNELIAWRSLPGSDIDTAGQIRFAPAPGDRGSEAHVSMDYVPPAGKLGHWIAALLGENPRRVIREDLRNFKRIMEVGELPTITGQPRGTCMGEGKRQVESEWKPLFA